MVDSEERCKFDLGAKGLHSSGKGRTGAIWSEGNFIPVQALSFQMADR